VPEKRDLVRKRDYMRAYYAENREKLLLRQAENDAARLEAKRAYNRARHHRLGEAELARKRADYEAKRPEKQEKQRNYYRSTREAHVLRVYARKKRLVAGRNITTPAQQVEIDGLYLFTQCFPWFEVDHILPLRSKHLSGLHILPNLQVLPRVTNRRKFNRTCPAHINIIEGLITARAEA